MDVISQPLSDTQDLLDLNRNLQSEIYAIHAENQYLLHEIQRLLTENYELLAEINTDVDMVAFRVAGAFIATVHHTMSDNVFDDQHRIVVLTEFQSNPFMLRLEPAWIAQLDVGETYVFEIETPILTRSLAEIERPGGILLGIDSPVSVLSIRIAEEYERGLPPYGMTLKRVLVDDN